ncbi:MAG: SMP-30/gluconolactonase/LRE family protein [Planctomycetaceae bacterium]|nr:SMP-30/gluconolactonase/LRE family protein [Planctomycetaceae bacterium]
MMRRAAAILLAALVWLSTGGAFDAAALELLLSSRDSNEIYKFDLATRVGTPFISGGASGLSGPVGMRYGPDGNLYVSNFYTSEIRKYNGTTGAPLGVFVSSKAGLSAPTDLRFGPDGNLYVANFGDSTILRFDGQTGAPLPGDNGKAFASGGNLAQGTSLKFNGNDLYVADFGSDRVLKYNITQSPSVASTVFANMTPFLTDDGFSPGGIAFGPNGDLYVSGLLGQNIGVFSSTGAPIRQFNAPSFSFPSDLLFTPDGQLLIASTGLNGIFSFDPLTGNINSYATPENPFGLYLTHPGIAIAGEMLFVAVPGDATEDAIVDGADYTIWADHYLQTTNRGVARGDFNHDGLVDGADYTIWADHYSPAPTLAALAVVPEPSTLVLAGAGSLAAILFTLRRTRRASANP